jgi:hypothetical protein
VYGEQSSLKGLLAGSGEPSRGGDSSISIFPPKILCAVRLIVTELSVQLIICSSFSRANLM